MSKSPSYLAWTLTLFWKRYGRSFTVSFILLLVSGLLAFPLLWMFFASFKANQQIYEPLRLLPSSFDTTYYRELFSGRWLPYLRQYGNALLLAGAQTALVLCLASATAFVFANYRFRFKLLLYVLTLTVILIPQQTLVVPQFEWLIRLRLSDMLLGVILPGSISSLAVLFFIEMIRRIPDELFDQARVEGASEYALYFLIALPLLSTYTKVFVKFSVLRATICRGQGEQPSQFLLHGYLRPALLSYAFIHFLLSWHDYLLPLVMLSTPDKMPVSVGLGSLFGSYSRVPYAVVMAGFTLTALPAILTYLATRRHLRSSLSHLIGE